MKLGILWSGGKDSCYAAYLAKKEGNDIACLITLQSENDDSFMFHTPSIDKVKQQAQAMSIPLLIKKTKGEKESELEDLELAILAAKQKYEIEGLVSGALASTYQSSRIQKICDALGIESFNPLWQKNQFEHVNDIIKCGMKVIITGVFAEPLNEDWLGREIDGDFIEEIKDMANHYEINPAGEGGEYESYVLFCPTLFSHQLLFDYDKSKLSIKGNKNSWKMEVEVEEEK
ncbi:TIGR00289 family protein [Candidatus Pacearchaeota archaeon CG10_big_fil_rev_8_21_14_0_10_32_14]|nr:MAG: TIGR00289 family protein [Candidatus Pacearchaeota archaeon CG10_big_fil_rev_8_21_14_0_10_32_14]